MHFEDELRLAVGLAKRAGEVVLEYYAREIVSESKMGVDNIYEPVTAADRSASRIIVDAIGKAFPEDGILSEEETDASDHRLSRDRVWIIDPIDGTAGFIKKDGDFAVQIGLAKRGRPVVGVVFLPARDLLYFASSGQGTFRSANGGPPERLAVSGKTDLSEMDIAVSRDHRSPKMTTIIRDLDLRKEIGRGSVGVKIGLIAERTCDLYIHLSHRTKFWDTCAPQIILEEAGGTLTDLFGNQFKYDLDNVMNLNGILASNGVAHDIVIERLGPILAKLGRSKVAEA